jgi:hypothetical protein
MIKKVVLSIVIAIALVTCVALPAAASDHLAKAANSQGVDNRGFANPVASNPSGTSGAMAAPATVPGEGNPNFGNKQGVPAVNLDEVVIRSGGNGIPQKP